MGRRKKTTKRKLAHPTLPMQQQLNLRHEGTHFDLRAIFDDLNQRHFRKRLRGYKVVWGRRRKHRPREQFVFGTIQEEDRMIRINPALDQPFVPLWFLRYVLYHEMLHSVVPDETLSRNRRRVHTEEFNRREREFPDYRRPLPIANCQLPIDYDLAICGRGRWLLFWPIDWELPMPRYRLTAFTMAVAISSCPFLLFR